MAQKKSTQEVQEAVDARIREILKPQKHLARYFQDLPIVLSKANRREMMVAALCSVDALRRVGVPELECLKRAKRSVVNVMLHLLTEESQRHRTPRKKAA